jgi:hypothetical protein
MSSRTSPRRGLGELRSGSRWRVLRGRSMSGSPCNERRRTQAPEPPRSVATAWHRPSASCGSSARRRAARGAQVAAAREQRLPWRPIRCRGARRGRSARAPRAPVPARGPGSARTRSHWRDGAFGRLLAIVARAMESGTWRRLPPPDRQKQRKGSVSSGERRQAGSTTAAHRAVPWAPRGQAPVVGE